MCPRCVSSSVRCVAVLRRLPGNQRYIDMRVGGNQGKPPDSGASDEGIGLLSELPGTCVRLGESIPLSMSDAMLLLMLCKIGVRGKLQTSPRKMVNTALNDEEKGIQDKESKEESILAMLGIIGTILNLVVIIFVYIYTTL
ncbi:hypothetical protein F2P79_021729 [Pimephales promelas]|nr:hypothetical protein F2P79_021729 [Pimephales promelas]